MSGFAWVTLATNDSYSLGALVLAHSLRQVNTAHQLAVLVTPGVSGAMREKLASVFNVVREVNILDSRDEVNLKLLQRPDLGITFTKLHCWRLTQFSKCVFLDADTLVLQNADELFERDEFSAAPDVGWPDCFNSGVFVYCPSEDTYKKLVQFALEKGSFDGGDQGLLNLYFSDWAHKDISKHLPFIYNMCSTACYSYLPAFKQFGSNVKIIHFIGNTKPWLQYFNTETRQVHVSPNLQHVHGIIQQWWNVFCSLVHPTLSTDMAGLAGALAQLTLGVPRTAEQTLLDDHLRRQGWEVGNIDYMGRDSFDNIWSKICATLADSLPVEATPAQAQPQESSPATATPPQDLTGSAELKKTEPALTEPKLLEKSVESKPAEESAPVTTTGEASSTLQSSQETGVKEKEVELQKSTDTTAVPPIEQIATQQTETAPKPEVVSQPSEVQPLKSSEQEFPASPAVKTLDVKEESSTPEPKKDEVVVQQTAPAPVAPVADTAQSKTESDVQKAVQDSSPKPEIEQVKVEAKVEQAAVKPEAEQEKVKSEVEPAVPALPKAEIEQDKVEAKVEQVALPISSPKPEIEQEKAKSEIEAAVPISPLKPEIEQAKVEQAPPSISSPKPEIEQGKAKPEVEAVVPISPPKQEAEQAKVEVKLEQAALKPEIVQEKAKSEVEAAVPVPSPKLETEQAKIVVPKSEIEQPKPEAKVTPPASVPQPKIEEAVAALPSVKPEAKAELKTDKTAPAAPAKDKVETQGKSDSKTQKSTPPTPETKAKQAAPTSPSPKSQAEPPKPKQSEQTAPSPKTKSETKAEQSPPVSPTKTEPKSKPKTAKTEAPAPKSQTASTEAKPEDTSKQQSQGSPKPEEQVKAPKTSATASKASPKTVAPKEASETPTSPAQPKPTQAKKAAAPAEVPTSEKPEEAPAAAAGPTPPPRKTAGTGGAKKATKTKK